MTTEKVVTSQIERMPTNGSIASEKMAVNSKDEKGLAVVDVLERGSLDEHEKVIYAEDQFTDKDYKRLRFKIDMIIMPIMMIIFGLNYSDKTSLSSGVVFVSLLPALLVMNCLIRSIMNDSANTQGLKEDTHLKPQEYNNLNSFFCECGIVACGTRIALC